ncbi:DUF742 domain-containing protein [Amycolatopsis sp. K13G38]|uniref:DUF742 domain-containing protein n=1 Tax=Amycolatopsis acididurans TaxID=2724524 RepID=A0ABX1J5B2_9PSEU|nr:DUF742 domain-containing protein [Amycolatopsis acididurans]NKQ53530.1 DUF742 domain-containing protein [Amycolatopsis acididurans]
MTSPEEEQEAVELWERPYTVTGGRTHPSRSLDLMSLVRATGRAKVPVDRLGREHAQALRLCTRTVSVAEVAAHLKQPVIVTKVLLSDLIESGAVATRSPATVDTSDPVRLKALLDGLRRL